MFCEPRLLILFLSSALQADADCILPRDDSEILLCPLSDEPQKGQSRRLMSHAPHHNTTLSMFVRPYWKMWAGLDFAHGFANGIFAMEQLWDGSVDKYFATSDAASILRVNNYEGGSSGIMQQPIVALSTKNGEVREVIRQFNGQFKQSFDAGCYPFDHQQVSFEVQIDFPVSQYWELFLFCSKGEEALDAAGNAILNVNHGGVPTSKNIAACRKHLGTSAVGMEWKHMTCTKASASSIICKMEGHRAASRVILNFVLPSVLVSVMSFASFQLPSSMSMPRIATTMIAMLTLINLRSAVSKTLPGSGDLSWIDDYFTVAIIFMFLNLICHIAVMRAAQKQHKTLSDFFDDIGCGVSGSLYITIPFARLLSQGCTEEGITPGTAVAVVVIGILMLLFLVAKAFVTKKAAFKEWNAKRKSTTGSIASTGIADEPSQGRDVKVSLAVHEPPDAAEKRPVVQEPPAPPVVAEKAEITTM